jgi:hypothetical protein
MMVTRLSFEQRRALTLLANSPDGITEVLLVRDRDFSRGVLASLVRHRLATTAPEVMMAGDTAINSVRITITDAGRRAIEE